MKITRLQQVTTKQNYLDYQSKKRNTLFFICFVAFMFFNCFLNAQELSEVDYDSSEKNFKSVNLSLGFGNSPFTDSKPAYLLSFEKNGILGSGMFGSALEIEKLFNTGVYIEYHNEFVSLLGIGLRVALDPLGFVDQFSNTQLEIANKLDVNVGAQWGYLIVFDELFGAIGGVRNFNPYLNARYYFTNNLGVHAELGRTASYTNFNVGISLRY